MVDRDSIVDRDNFPLPNNDEDQTSSMVYIGDDEDGDEDCDEKKLFFTDNIDNNSDSFDDRNEVPKIEKFTNIPPTSTCDEKNNQSQELITTTSSLLNQHSSPAITKKKTELPNSFTGTFGLKRKAERGTYMEYHKKVFSSSATNHQQLPQINGYGSLAEVNRHQEQNNGVVSNGVKNATIVASCQQPASVTTTPATLNQQNISENDLLMRLIKTKINKLPTRLKLTCENELIQVLFKYELMAIEETNDKLTTTVSHQQCNDNTGN